MTFLSERGMLLQIFPSATQVTPHKRFSFRKGVSAEQTNFRIPFTVELIGFISDWAEEFSFFIFLANQTAGKIEP